MRIRALIGVTGTVLTAVALAAAPTLQASAASTPTHGVATLRHAVKKPTTGKTGGVKISNAAKPLIAGTNDGGVSSTQLSSWQTNNTVWALAYTGGNIYAGGQFTSVRPPTDPVGTGEVARTFIAAFNSTTGALNTSFNPTITGTSAAEVTALAVSPDGKTLYIGGNFNHVNGVYRDDLAAINLTTGALTSWAPSAEGTVLTIAPSPDGTSVYVGGDFPIIDATARTYAAEVTASGTGTLDAWAPNLNDPVTSIAVAPDESRVILGGYFTSFNGVTQNAIGSADPTTGASKPFAATIVPNDSGCSSSVKDVIIGSATPANPAGVAYISAEGTGGGCFDGDFAANVTDGSLVWQNDCLGATQAIEIVHGFLFKGSHAHDCAYEAGGYPQVNAAGGGWVTHHLLDQSLTDGTLGHWTPDTNIGPTNGLGPRVFATDGNQLFLGGDFSSVNGVQQQGIAIFPSGTDPQYPSTVTTAPTVTSTSAGVDSVTFPAVSSRDIGQLNYLIYRDGGKTPIATLTATSWPWALPVLHYQDTGLTPGSSHTYTYTVSDGPHTRAQSPASAPVTVASTSPAHNYEQTALADSPSFFWPLNESSGSQANDATSNGFNGTYESGTTQGASGPFSGQTATAFDGNSGNVTAQNSVSGPQNFSIEGWFNTSTKAGGKLIGFGNSQTGMSTNYDRHIYMMNDGQLVFGVYNNGTETAESPNVYNDGQWHYVVATYNSAASGNNLSLYVDGQLVATAASSTAQAFSGYWRVGGDNLNGWNLDPWGSNSQGTTQPNSYFFNGTMSDVAVYPTALSAAQVAAHYAAALNQQL